MGRGTRTGRARERVALSGSPAALVGWMQASHSWSFPSVFLPLLRLSHCLLPCLRRASYLTVLNNFVQVVPHGARRDPRLCYSAACIPVCQQSPRYMALSSSSSPCSVPGFCPLRSDSGSLVQELRAAVKNGEGSQSSQGFLPPPLPCHSMAEMCTRVCVFVSGCLHGCFRKPPLHFCRLWAL